MEQNGYKKNYQGEYAKSYRDQALWKKTTELKKIEYDSISKKIDSQRYNQKEKSNAYDIGNHKANELGRVYADGRKTQQRETNKQFYSAQASNKAKTTEQPINNTTSQTTVTETPTYSKPQEKAPIVVKDSKATQQTTQKPQTENQSTAYDDGNYNFNNPPVKEISTGVYRNTKTGKNIDVDQARGILIQAGYTIEGQNVAVYLFSYIGLLFIFTKIAPFIAIFFGLIKHQTKKTMWKKKVNGITYKVSMPVSIAESNFNKLIGKIAVGVGLISFGIYVYLYGLF